MHLCCVLHKEGLKHALIVGAYLSLVTFPISILSAPTPMSSSRPSGEPLWLNPCGTGNENGAFGDEISDETLLNHIVVQAKLVQNQAKTFKELYVEKTFNTGFNQHHEFYKDKDYDWLPTKSEIPKKLHESVPRDHLENLELQTTLINVHMYLQKIAVGLEQVAHDERRRGGPFISDFETTEKHLRAVLCEVQTAIIEKDLPMPENVTRDIMLDQFRQMDNTSMNIRNWIIYRDYLNMLEYIIEVFEYFKTKLPTIG